MGGVIFMIIRSDNSYVQNPLFPDSNFLGLEGVIVIDDNSELAERFIRFFPHGKIITDDKGNAVDVEDNTPSIDISDVITQKQIELSAECEKTIVAGVDVGDAHYSLTLEDQANILALTPLAQAGNSVFYHQDGEMCREYSSDEFLAVVNAATVFKTLQTTYCNLLMRQVEAMTDAEEVRAVKYGVTELTGEFAERYEIIKATLIGDNGETNS